MAIIRKTLKSTDTGIHLRTYKVQTSIQFHKNRFDLVRLQSLFFCCLQTPENTAYILQKFRLTNVRYIFASLIKASVLWCR